MYEFNEFEMGRLFKQSLVENKILKAYRFNVIEGEVTSQQGIPDFIAIETKSNGLYYKNQLTHIEATSKLLALLKKFSGRKFDYMKDNTGLSENVLKKALREAMEENFILKKGSLYYLNSEIILQEEIWAFELKLADWKRAIFQALQYKAFASYSVAVFPAEKENIIKENIQSFKKLNVGVLIFDLKNKKSKWLSRPKKSKPVSKWQMVYILLKLSKMEKVN